VGVRINIAQGKRLIPNEMPENLKLGSELYRNRDQAFERLLEKRSAERRIRVWMLLSECADGLRLEISDEDGIRAEAKLAQALEPAQNADKALATLRDHLGKLGGTHFEAVEISLNLSHPWFLPASAINGLRRQAIEALEAARQAAWQPLPRALPVEPPAPYPETELSYLANVYNAKARAFYTKHGVQLIDAAYEANEEKGEVSLMITKHCLRYSFNLCPKEVKGIRPDPMTLMQGKDRLTLTFDCKKCEMHVVGKLRKHRTIQIHAH
jgi:putative protease